MLDFLASVLLGGEAGRGELEAALDRALSLSECHVVPFFGTFLADLMGILQATPSLVVLAEDGQEVEVGICISVYLCIYNQLMKCCHACHCSLMNSETLLPSMNIPGTAITIVTFT